MPTWAIVIIVVSLLVSAVFWSLPWLLKLRGVEMRRRSLFGTVLIFEHADEDGTPVRLLNVNGTFQSATYLSDELWAELVCAYHRTMVDEIDRHGRVRSVLVIGGGGYSLPKHLIAHTKRMEVTVVEIDPKITQVARERFFLDRAEGLAGERLVLVNADGWEYLRTSPSGACTSPTCARRSRDGRRRCLPMCATRSRGSSAASRSSPSVPRSPGCLRTTCSWRVWKPS